MEKPSKRAPKRKHERIILQFDYDCFYAQVHENRDPSLKALPVGIKQKNILATCNYNARKLGVRKLMLISEAKKICPDLVLVEGEDLTLFRDASKVLFHFVRSFSWNGKVERLGLDEIFMDVTDIVEYNLLCLNRNSLAMSFFFLSEKDPEQGFPCDLTSVAGCSEGIAFEPDNPDHLRLLLGSHLARHVRTKLEEDFGFTSTCGISTNKVLSKLVGAKNKPRNQTTLLALDGDQVSAFMDSHALRRVPGIGFKMACMIESRVTSKAILDDSHTFESNVTVGEARASNKISPSALEALLAGPGAEKGVGARIWGLLHGVDPTEVKEFSDVPSQISIEDTYSGLQTQERITDELYKLACSLLRRMRIDLLVDDVNAEESGVKKWLARPRTLRLSVRSWPESGKMTSQSYNRVSRSAALPGFVFDTKLEISQIVDRLVPEALLPLLRRLEAEKGQKWNLQLINICVANMVAGSSENKKGAGRDIANMFKRQDEVLRPWKVIQDQRDMDEKAAASSGSASDDSETEETWETSENAVCPVCNCLMPSFAMKAHMRYHDMED